jgi:Cupin-like domain
MANHSDIAEFGAAEGAEFAQHCKAGLAPAIWRGGGSGWTAVREWTFDKLRARFGDQRMRVRGSDQALDVFFGSVVEREMSFSDYLDAILEPKHGSHRPYLGNFLVNHPLMVPQVLSLLDDVDFPDIFPELASRQFRIWVAGAGQQSTIHNDNYENLNAQIIGLKSFLLFPPEDHECLYAKQVNEGLWSSPVNSSHPDLNLYPRFPQARALRCTLGPGDLLHLPKFWWHQATSDTAAININVWHLLGDDLDETWEARLSQAITL